jgi:hypothetical protein
MFAARRTAESVDRHAGDRFAGSAYDASVRAASFPIILAFACAPTEGSEPAPVHSGPTIEQARPGSEAAKGEALPGVHVDEVALHCALGLTPASASDGRRVVKRGIELRHDLAVVKIEMSEPPHRAHLLARSDDELARMRKLATAVQATALPQASAPVPDGQQCRLRVVVDGVAKVDAAVDPTPSPGPLAELVTELRGWMHTSEPMWPEPKDPEVGRCMAAAGLAETAKFHLHEVVIERDGKRRYMFVDPTELSTADHFGCEFLDGKPHILPEG